MGSIKDITTQIVESYRVGGGANHIGGLDLPSRARVARILAELEELIFPGFACDDTLTAETIEFVTGARVARVVDDLTRQVELDLVHERRLGRNGDTTTVVDADTAHEARAFTIELLQTIPQLRQALNLDVQALLDGDPAVRSREEVILAYPGLIAIVVHRIANMFWKRGVRLLARMMSEIVHGKTGIDIHPGATIGRSFYIDHGTGVVIGETTVIGDHVKLYQGVSLGALSVNKRLQDQRRHPTLGDHVTIYAGATILGGTTRIGHHSIIGGKVWLTGSVDPHSIVMSEEPKLTIRKRKGATD